MVLNSPKGFLGISSSDLTLYSFTKLKHPKSSTFGIDALSFCICMAQCHPSSQAFSQLQHKFPTNLKCSSSPCIASGTFENLLTVFDQSQYYNLGGGGSIIHLCLCELYVSHLLLNDLPDTHTLFSPLRISHAQGLYF
jgi:hypothetical protein